MRLYKSERARRVSKMGQHFDSTNAKIINYESISKRRLPQNNYDTINHMQLGGTINDKKKTDRPTSWTPARKNQLERLANNQKGVSKWCLNVKL